MPGFHGPKGMSHICLCAAMATISNRTFHGNAELINDAGENNVVVTIIK